ncbi:hypothetical protein ASD62_11705 [Phycicoccus sp. Root563]|nr:hypothetical protein ASD62_11705 [Phycicoccus sp. Root563]
MVNKQSDVVIVSFHGATDRKTTVLPRFERLRTLLELDVSSVFFSDPTLHLDPKIWLTWYTGWGDVDAHRAIADLSQAIARSIGASIVIFTGSSGGGFAALQVSALVPDSVAVAFNAQTDIGRYLVEGEYYTQQKDYVRVVWPEIWASFETPDSIAGSGWTASADDRVSALSRYSVPRGNRVYLLQNIEEYHYEDHFLPFLDAAWRGGNHENIVPWVNRQGEKHVVPTLKMFTDCLKKVIAEERSRDRRG